MPAKSKSQQRLMGMVHAYKKGKLKHASRKIMEVARHISDEDARDFAKTKHDGLEEKKASEAAIISRSALSGGPIRIIRDDDGMIQVIGPGENDPKDAMVVSRDEIMRLVARKLTEKKAFDFNGIMSKLEKMSAGTRVVVYENNKANEFGSIAEAAAFIASRISRGPTVSQVKEMLSQRQTEIFGMKIEYPETSSDERSGVNDLASMFRSLTGAYGASSYGM